jgi:hypothetical protein
MEGKYVAPHRTSVSSKLIMSEIKLITWITAVKLIDTVTKSIMT